MALKPKENKEESSETEDILVFEAIYQNQKLIIKDKRALEEFYQKSYIGTKLITNQLELDIEEALLLLERDRITISDQNHKTMAVESLLTKYQNSETIWVKFLVYRDLRQRGYVVRRGFGQDIDFRLFPRGASREEDVAKYFIYILDEANPVRLNRLERITQESITARKQLLLAVLDRLGEPTYYSLEQYNLKLNQKKEKTW